jgi:hypothetical protein
LGEVDYQAWVPMSGIGVRNLGLLILEGARKVLYKAGGIQRWVSSVVDEEKSLCF